MSGPTKGMVAGQPIKTGAQTEAFDEGYDRIFGPNRKPVRGRFVFDEEAGQMVEVGMDWEDPTLRKGSHKSEAEVYGDLRATDGTDISSRTKHRRYMQANGLAHVSDFSQHWKEKAKERERVLSGEADTKQRKAEIGRALYEAKKGKRR